MYWVLGPEYDAGHYPLVPVTPACSLRGAPNSRPGERVKRNKPEGDGRARAILCQSPPAGESCPSTCPTRESLLCPKLTISLSLFQQVFICTTLNYLALVHYADLVSSDDSQ
jgi:hypothetical protein